VRQWSVAYSCALSPFCMSLPYSCNQHWRFCMSLFLHSTLAPRLYRRPARPTLTRGSPSTISKKATKGCVSLLHVSVGHVLKWPVIILNM
jgi:hypothetical protein